MTANPTPLTREQRRERYHRQNNGRRSLTPRQRRRIDKKAGRALCRALRAERAS